MTVLDFTRCRRPDGTFYGTGGECRKGTQDESREEVDDRLLLKAGVLSSSDLDAMEKTWKEYEKTGVVNFPFKIPTKYDDKSGTPEACDELTSLREKLVQDKKTGKITIPDSVKVSDKARELVEEWNSLDRSRVYVDSNQGNKLNVSGLGVMGGPRDSVPKDALRGLVQYVALRRQDAEMIDTPKGKVIDTYRDPFTGKRRSFEGDTGKKDIDIVASQDHWERPFGIYGIRSENDVRNTVYMPISMNVSKGEASPGRYLYQSLVSAGRIEGKVSADKAAIGGFSGRYDRDPSKDFLPRGQTRESERKALTRNAREMFAIANSNIDQKYLPKIGKDVAAGNVTSAKAADHVYSIAKQESKRNYYGGLLRFGDGERIFTPYEANLLKGIDLNSDTKTLKSAIRERVESQSDSPTMVLTKVMAGRS
jgi:hypothetical protein